MNQAKIEAYKNDNIDFDHRSMIWIGLSRNSPSLLYLASEVKARLASYADSLGLMTWDISLGLNVVSPAWQAQKGQTSKMAAEGSKGTERERETEEL